MRRTPDDDVTGHARGDLSELRERSPAAATLLPDVVHDSPAAVLLVELDSGQVVFANRLAAQLAPGTTLPVSVDDWSRAAGLEDIDGDDLAGDHGDAARPGRGKPLSRVARGEPVLGEAVTAARPGRGLERREPLWVIGLPLSDAPAPLGRQAVVVFLPVRQSSAVAGAQESAAALRDRALLAARISITISDPSQPDNPLIWVNPAFLEVTGRTSEQVIGRNCRFLQGPDTDRAVVAEIRDAIADGRPITTTLRNYRADGTPFWNQVSISPVLDGHGTVTHHVGVQTDVTDRVEFDLARETALAQVRIARDRLALLAATTNQLAASLDPAEIVRLLSELVVPRLGAWSATFTATDRDDTLGLFLRHPDHDTDPDVGEAVDRLSVLLTRLPPDHEIHQMMRGERGPLLMTGWDGQARWPTGEVAGLIARLGVGSLAFAPIPARGRVLGVLVIVSTPGEPVFDEEDLAVLVDVTTRAGLALDNAQLYAREHQAAETLQRALLPVLPDIAGLDVSAQYLPATARNAVGGDWYDVLRLRDDLGVGIAVGDVMGHDLAAAAAMGQLRSVLRSYAYPGARPAAVLEQLDQLVQSLQMGSLATCVYGRLTRPDPTGDAEFAWSNAGHPPPMLVGPDGRVEVLLTSASRIVGVPFHSEEERGTAGDVRDEGRVTVPVGATLLLYTDGLVEERDRDIDAGIEMLRRLVEDRVAPSSSAELVRLLADLRAVTERDDDVALLAVRVL